MISLSAIIPATDRRVTLARVVEALARAAAAPEEVIVVDQPPNIGPAAARNLGARRAMGDVLVFVDADVEVHEDALMRIRAAFESDPKLGAVFGSYDDDPAEGNTVSGFRNLLHHHVHQRGAGVATTFWAGLGAVRRDVFFAVGGFDEERFPHPSVEDIELGMRLHRQGTSIRLDPAIRGKHLKRWTFAEMTQTDLFRRGVPWLRLLLEDGSQSSALNLGWRDRIGAGTSLLLVTALARRRIRLAGGALLFLVALDRQFYLLLLRRRGAYAATAGVVLHLSHRLTSAIAVPIAVTGHVCAPKRERIQERSQLARARRAGRR